MATQEDKLQAQRERHQQQLELEREKQRTAKIKANEQRRSRQKGLLQRETIGRESSSKKMLGDALTTVATGTATGLWSATRTGSGGYFWSAGLMGLGAIGMIESQAGTFLESGSAGMLGANGTVFLLKLLGMIK